MPSASAARSCSFAAIGAGGELSCGEIQRELLRSVRDCDHSELRSLLRRRGRKGSKKCKGVGATDPHPSLSLTGRGLKRDSQVQLLGYCPWQLRPFSQQSSIAADWIGKP